MSQYRPPYGKDEPAAHKSAYATGVQQWTSDKTAAPPIRMGAGGLAAMERTTLAATFKRAVDRHPEKVVMKHERGADGYGVVGKNPNIEGATWKTWTYAEYYAESRRAAKAYLSLGMGRGDVVNIIGFNSPEWFMADLGATLMGGIAAGIYTTNKADAAAYIAKHSGAKVVVCEDESQLDKFVAEKGQLPELKTVVIWGAYDGDSVAKKAKKAKLTVLNWGDFLDLGNGVEESALEAAIAAVQPEQCCQLIYTSGTTGRPKAVMISHDNILFEARNALHNMTNAGSGVGMAGEERIISYLPLSHVAGMMVDIVCGSIGMAAFAERGWGCVVFARADALKGSLLVSLQAAQPTMFLGVPRVWEKVAEAMKAKARANPATGAKKKLVDWAKRTGKANAYAQQLGSTTRKPLMTFLAKALVFKKVRAALGLSALKFAFTGAAPITVETLEFFGQLGIQVNEVYGMSECTGATTWSTDKDHKWGSCGWAMPGTEVKLVHDPARDEPGQGEICYRGRHIMMGYLANPALGKAHVAEIAGKNDSAIDAEGWLHSGDVGRVDEYGMYYITGRIKELIIGAGGENIAPVPIEDAVKANCPGLSNVMMVGDKRKYNTMLVTLKAVMDPATGTSTDALDGAALDVSPGVTTVSAALSDPAWQAYIQKGIDAYNEGKLCVSRAQKVQKFRILAEDFSEAGGELTATLKLKRGPTSKKHAAVIEEMYSGGAKGGQA